MKTIALAAAMLTLAGSSVSAWADDAAAHMGKLFTDVCLAKIGHLDKVENWAADQHLRPILNPQALAVFAGRMNTDGTMRSFAGGGVPGSGKAWAVPEGADRFVVATREDPESCIVWAQKADPADVQALYKQMVEDASKPGIEVTLAQDRKADIPDGQVHIKVYRIWSGSALTSIALAVASVSRSGGPYQAMLEAQRLISRDGPINPMVPLERP